MEETRSSNPKPLRCVCVEIPDIKDVKECFDVVKNLISSVLEISYNFNAKFYIKNIDNELKMFEEMLQNIDQKLMDSINNHRFYEFTHIMDEVIHISGREDFNIKELKRIAGGGNPSNKVRIDTENYLNTAKFEQFKSEALKEIEERNQQKIEQEKKLREKIKDECKETIRQIEAKIQEEQQLNKKLEHKNLEITKKFKAQAEELEVQKKVIASMIAQKEEEEKEKVKEKKKYEQEKNEISYKFNEIYEKNIGEKISNTPDFYFNISLIDTKDKNLLKELYTEKLRLPDLRAVQICCVSDTDSDLVNFIDNCTPTQLKLLRFNFSGYSSIATKAKFYMQSLPKLVSATTEEVFLYHLDFSEAELEKIVKSSCNAETLIFEGCDIHCSTVLDFGSALKYKTKTINFQFCGNTADSNRKTDWVSSPACFDNIIEAISKSGLRDSLQTICIDYNQTLSVEKVQQTLNEKGMSHITVDKKFVRIKQS